MAGPTISTLGNREEAKATIDTTFRATVTIQGQPMPADAESTVQVSGGRGQPTVFKWGEGRDGVVEGKPLRTITVDSTKQTATLEAQLPKGQRVKVEAPYSGGATPVAAVTFDENLPADKRAKIQVSDGNGGWTDVKGQTTTTGYGSSTTVQYKSPLDVLKEKNPQAAAAVEAVIKPDGTPPKTVLDTAIRGSLNTDLKTAAKVTPGMAAG